METMCITVVDSVNNEMRGVNKPPKVLPKYKVLATDGKTTVEVVETPPPDGSEKENNTVGEEASSSRTSPAEALVNTTNNDEDASEASSGRAAQRQGRKKAVKKIGLELGGQLEVGERDLVRSRSGIEPVVFWRGKSFLSARQIAPEVITLELLSLLAALHPIVRTVTLESGDRG